MAFTALLVTQFLAAGLLLALAFWLLWIDFTNRIHRAFALLLGLNSLLIVQAQLTKIHPWVALSVWEAYRWYVVLGIAPSLAYFFLVYNWRNQPQFKRVGGFIILASTVLIECLYAFTHGLVVKTGPDGRLMVGALGWLTEFGYVGMSACSLWFAVQANRTTSPAASRFARMLALGFMVDAIAVGMIPWSFYLFNGFGAWTNAYVPTPDAAIRVAVALASAPLAFVSMAVLLRGASASGASGAWRAWIWALGAGATLCAFVGAWRNPTSFDSYLSSFLIGVARLVGASVLAFCLGRQRVLGQRLFNLDMNARVTIKRSTLAAIFFAAFFVVGEGSQVAIQSFALKEGPLRGIAPYVGIVGAGLLMFVFQPLQRWAERVSRATMPDARPLAEMSVDERAKLYQEQAEVAWLDGTLTIKERRLLDQLQERLGLDPGLTSRLESQVASGRVTA